MGPHNKGGYPGKMGKIVLLAVIGVALRANEGQSRRESTEGKKKDTFVHRKKESGKCFI